MDDHNYYKYYCSLCDVLVDRWNDWDEEAKEHYCKACRGPIDNPDQLELFPTLR